MISQEQLDKLESLLGKVEGSFMAYGTKIARKSKKDISRASKENV